MRYKYKINNDITIEAMSFKKMLKSLASKFKEGEIVNVVYKNKKDNLINKDVKVGSNDWNIFRCTNRVASHFINRASFYSKRANFTEGLDGVWKQ